MDLSGKKVLAVGLARTGEAVAVFCKKKGARVTVADICSESVLGARAQKMRDMGVNVEPGPHRQELFESADLIVVSPGVPHMISVLEAARKKAIPVIGEVELASLFIKEPIVAVTGTNGKTTITTLIGDMLRASGIRVFVGGNIGNPLINYPGQDQGADVVVAEISSFQLDTIKTFSPKVAVLTNITDDHLDRYADMAAYTKAKAMIFKNQTPDDFAVLNGVDQRIRSLESVIRAQKLFFTFRGEDEAGADIGPDRIDFKLDEKKGWSLFLNKTGLVGGHNRENIAAASLAAGAAGATNSGMQRALDDFSGLAHRLEMVREISGVRYYNDSKATNVDAVYRALEGFDCPVILIMGGRDKGSDFKGLRQVVKDRVTRLFVTGEAANAIASALSSCIGITHAKDIGHAVEMAGKVAKPNSVVVLSPGCASFDCYNNYKERGIDFCRAVNAL